MTDGGGDMNGTETPESDPADTRNTGTSKGTVNYASKFNELSN